MDFPPLVNTEATVFRAELGVLPPNPRDLSHYSQQGARRGWVNATLAVSAAATALRSHPCVALSPCRYLHDIQKSCSRL